MVRVKVKKNSYLEAKMKQIKGHSGSSYKNSYRLEEVGV